MIQRRKKWNKHIWGKERRTENRKIQYCSSLKENKFLLAKPSCSFLPWWLLSAVLPRCFDWERSVDIIKCIFILITFISFLHASSQKKKNKMKQSVLPMEHSPFPVNVSLQKIFREIWGWITICSVGKAWPCRWRIAGLHSPVSF